MVAVSVRKENGIDARESFHRLGADGVGHDPRINERDLSGPGGERKRAVTEIRDAIAFEIEHARTFRMTRAAIQG